MAPTMVAKLSSSRTRSATSRLTSEPRVPIAIPTSDRFNAAASLTPSSCHGDDVTLPLERLDEPEFLLGPHPSEDVDLDQCGIEGCSLEAVEIFPGQHTDARNADVDCATARAVAGWSPVMHHDADSRRPSAPHRIRHFGTRGIPEQHQGQQGQRVLRVAVAACHGNHPEPLARVGVGLLTPGLSIGFRERAPGKEHFGRPLEIAD